MSKLEDVNITDIAAVIRLGCQTMQNVFNAEDNQVPFFSFDGPAKGRSEFQPICSNGYLHFSEVLARQTIQLRFPLKQSRICLSERLHTRPIRVKMRGDAVVRMDNVDAESDIL